MQLEQILQRRPDLWRGNAAPAAAPRGEPTGFADLDALLPWHGWPPGALTELLCPQAGGGLSLVLPALAGLSRGARWLLLVDPPFLPYAPALAAAGVALGRMLVAEAGEAAAWAAEQGLRSGACSAVLLWGGRWQGSALRRLQLAAETGGALAMLFRDPGTARDPSPAALRLQVEPAPAGLAVRVLKQRGGRAGGQVGLNPWAGSSVLQPTQPDE
jgi:hypothetical protein